MWVLSNLGGSIQMEVISITMTCSLALQTLIDYQVWPEMIGLSTL